jgi:hypothetical protein
MVGEAVPEFRAPTLGGDAIRSFPQILPFGMPGMNEAGDVLEIQDFRNCQAMVAGAAIQDFSRAADMDMGECARLVSLVIGQRKAALLHAFVERIYLSIVFQEFVDRFAAADDFPGVDAFRVTLEQFGLPPRYAADKMLPHGLILERLVNDERSEIPIARQDRIRIQFEIERGRDLAADQMRIYADRLRRVCERLEDETILLQRIFAVLCLTRTPELRPKFFWGVVTAVLSDDLSPKPDRFGPVLALAGGGGVSGRVVGIAHKKPLQGSFGA